MTLGRATPLHSSNDNPQPPPVPASPPPAIPILEPITVNSIPGVALLFKRLLAAFDHETPVPAQGAPVLAESDRVVRNFAGRCADAIKCLKIISERLPDLGTKVKVTPDLNTSSHADRLAIAHVSTRLLFVHDILALLKTTPSEEHAQHLNKVKEVLGSQNFSAHIDDAISFVDRLLTEYFPKKAE